MKIISSAGLLSILLCACIGGTIAAASGSSLKTPSHRFKSKTHATSVTRPDVKKIAPVEDKSTIHEVVFAIKQKNLDKLESILMDVSAPESAHYGQHWSWKDVNTFTRDVAAEQAVKNYLNAIEGVEIVKETQFGDYLTVQAPVAVWETMFATQFHQYESTHPLTKKVSKLIRAGEYSVPMEIADHVEAVHRTVQFPMQIVSGGMVREAANEEVAPASNAVNTAAAARPGKVYPSTLFSFYNIPNGVPAGNYLVNQAIFASLGEYMSPLDLTKFQANSEIAVQGISGSVGGHVSDSACYSDANNCAEANLDVQYIMAMAQKVPTYFDYYADVNSTIDWVDWIGGIANMTNPYNVISISYGGYEIGQDPSLLDAFNVEAQKLGIIGTSIFASSGDDGVAGFAVRDEPDFCGYYPQFPASSPYVTAVGGTMGPESGLNEVVCQPKYSLENGIISSGGGFSDFYPAPSWQQQQISNYFTTVAGTSKAPYPGYNRTGRGYPDVSLLALNYQVVIGGTTYSVSGTSASSPSFAGLISTINAQRKGAGLSLVGWINPALYQYAPVYAKDITFGSNNCTADGSPCCAQGFYAATGWDPATGIGSIDYQKFTSIFVGSVPTTMPTSMKLTVDFTANQVINGITIDTYNTNPSLYYSVIVETLTDCMSSINANDISGFSALASSSTRRFLTITTAGSGAIAIGYTVTSTVPYLSTISVSQQLTANVAYGYFTAQLNGNAASAGATALVGCSSNSVTTQSQMTDDYYNSNNSNSLSDGAIAGIVIGFVVGVALIGAWVWYLIANKKSAMAEQANPISKNVAM